MKTKNGWLINVYKFWVIKIEVLFSILNQSLKKHQLCNSYKKDLMILIFQQQIIQEINTLLQFYLKGLDLELQIKKN